MNAKRIAVLVSVLSLVACGGGGGGGGGDDSVRPASAQELAASQGLYAGYDRRGVALYGLVLETGETWMLYGAWAVTSTSTALDGILQFPSLIAGGNKLSGAFSDYSDVGNGAGTVRGTIEPGPKLTGSIAQAGQSAAFSMSLVDNGYYSYGTPASLPSIAGSWTGVSLFGVSTTVNIDSVGNITGQDTNSCAFTGSIVPRASGKNVFDVSVSFAVSAACTTSKVSGLQGRGVAITFPTTSPGVSQLIVAAVDRTRSMGVTFVANR